MLYHAPYGVTDPNAGYQNGDPSQGLAGSIPPAESIEYPQREIVNLITKGGYVPSDADLYQMTRGVRRALFAFATDTGSQNSLSVAVDPPITAYEQGTELRVMCAYDNTGPVTIRVNGLSTQNIVRKDGTPLIAGDLRQGGVAVIVYDGANFQLTSGTTGSVTVTGGWFNGADYIVDVGTPNHIVGSPPIAPTAYAAGQGFTILVANRNTGPVDINVNALGAKTLNLPGGLPVAAGDIMPGMLIRVWYDGTAFKMLSPIYMERIDSAITWIVGPNAGADFVDLNAAMFWLSRRRIDTAGTVKFSLQGSTSGNALVHNYSVPVIIEHPDGERLTIAGGAMTSAQAPKPGNFTSTGVTAAAINADSNSNVAMLRSKFKTELKFNLGGSPSGGLQIVSDVGLVQNILVTGGATLPVGGNSNTGIYVGGAASVQIDTVASAIWPNSTWYIDVSSSVVGNNFYAVGSTLFSVGIAHNGNLIVLDAPLAGGTGNFIIAGAYVDGIQAAHGAVMQINTPESQPRFYSCGQNGINHWGCSSFHCQSIFALHCGYALIQSAGGANAWVSSSAISYANQGFVAAEGSFIDCNTSYTAAIASGDYNASNGGNMYAAAFQNGAAQFSPARNTNGNSNAYIAA